MSRCKVALVGLLLVLAPALVHAQGMLTPIIRDTYPQNPLSITWVNSAISGSGQSWWDYYTELAFAKQCTYDWGATLNLGAQVTTAVKSKHPETTDFNFYRADLALLRTMGNIRSGYKLIGGVIYEYGFNKAVFPIPVGPAALPPVISTSLSNLVLPYFGAQYRLRCL